MSSSYRVSLEKWLSELPVKAEMVIDVGGSQLGLPERVKSWEVVDYKIADLPSPHMFKNKSDLIIDLNNYNISKQSVNDYRGMGNLVFCLEVFEYVYDPINAMKILKDLLNMNGTLYISAPFYYPVHQPVEDDCLRYTEQGLKKIIESVGLKHIKTNYRLCDGNGLANANYYERLKAAKHFHNHNVLGFIMEIKK